LISDANLNEFTTIIFDSAGAFSRIGASLISSQLDRIKVRLNQIEKWVEEGHTLIILLRNIVLACDNAPFLLDELPPFDCVQYGRSTGTQIEYCGGASAAGEILRPLTSRLRYELVISASNLEPLLRVQRASKGLDQFVGGIVKKGAGRIVLVPVPAAGTNPEVYPQYLEAVVYLAEQILGQPAELPAWTAHFLTAEEAKALGTIDASRAQISEIENAIRVEEDRLSQAARLKTLFAVRAMHSSPR
jgi:hypothetical protein